MSFGLLGFPREPKPDPVTAETQRWLAAEAQRVADDDALVEAARRHRAQADADPADTVRAGDPSPTECGTVSPSCRARKVYICTRPPGHRGQHVATMGSKHPVLEVWPNDGHLEGLPHLRGTRLENGRDADLVATAERLGDEAGQRDRQAAIDGAATTLRAHMHRQAHSWGSDRCACGWWGPDHVQHVAEQLAAVGALGDLGPKLPAPRPTPRTGSFASGEKRTFADGGD